MGKKVHEGQGNAEKIVYYQYLWFIVGPTFITPKDQKEIWAGVDIDPCIFWFEIDSVIVGIYRCP